MAQESARERAKRDIANDPALDVVGAIKNGAELAVVAGLFSFIGTNYESREALIVSIVLKVSLAVFIGAHIQHRIMNIADSEKKHFFAKLLLSGLLGASTVVAIQVYLISPVLKAIERQLAATPPALQLQAAPARAETQALPSAGTAAPKPVAAPSAEATAAPAPSVLPSVVQTRSSSPEERKPD